MSELIVKDNALMNASYNLDLVEQRLIFSCYCWGERVRQRNQCKWPSYSPCRKLYQSVWRTQNNGIPSLKRCLQGLICTTIQLSRKRERGRANITSRWVSQIAYIDETATVEIIFAPAVVPLITRLEKQFTQYDIEQISGLSSAYAVRMYELLICWRSTGKPLLLN